MTSRSDKDTSLLLKNEIKGLMTKTELILLHLSFRDIIVKEVNGRNSQVSIGWSLKIGFNTIIATILGIAGAFIVNRLIFGKLV